ncbi:MAG: DsbC family protein, partial [Methyloversatilis sp.]|nr:DsbC family protein [Methyloversatilis sp.]
MSIKHTAALLCALAASTAWAGPEDTIKAAVESTLGAGAKVEGVTKTPYLGLYEVRVGGEILYTDEKANYLILGEILDAKTRQNITQARVNQLSAINFAELPLDVAIKQVRGNGKRVIATFEDPNCGYCKKLAKELLTLNDVTVYTFLTPVLGPDSQ